MAIDYSKTGQKLKKLGLVEYDFRKKLSTGQKSRISKLRHEYGHVLRHPEMFHMAKVGKDTAKVLKASGFKVTPKRKAIIPLHEYTSAHIKKGVIEFRSGRMTEKTILAGSKDFHRKLKELSTKKLPRNSMVTARIGDNGPFNRSRFGNYADLYHYVFNVFTPKDLGVSKESLVMQMSVVTIHQNPKPKNGKKKGSSK